MFLHLALPAAQQLVCAITRFCRFVLLLTIASMALPPSAIADQVEIGKQIYLKGQLPKNKALQGKRANGISLDGEAAACEKCHRASGMGSVEGTIIVPPVTGNFLFATEANRPMALLDTRAAKNVSRPHAPYTLETLSRALRKGVNVSGKPMNPLMPRYDLTNAETKALMAYLKKLSAKLSPGVGLTTLHFATIIAPGTDPKQRDALLGMMRVAFTQRNASQQPSSGRMRMPFDLLPRTLRNWELSVWELQGAPDGWAKQLEEFYRHQPVFAVISGLSNSSWQPVQDFCEQQKLPCILPSVALPPKAQGFYSLYFSRGVTLEADVLAKHFQGLGDKAPKQLVQVYSNDEVGHAAADALAQAVQGLGVKVENHMLGSQDMGGIYEALNELTDKDAVMLWLKPADMQGVLKGLPKAIAAAAYSSGFLMRDQYASPPTEWQGKLKVIYPYEIGKKRDTNLRALTQWLKTWKLPKVNETLQSEVFFDLLFLTDLTSQMLDNLYGDYLVERAEDMLSVGTNSSVYPYLSLARGQRFASKGAYIAKIGKDGKLEAETDWIVP